MKYKDLTPDQKIKARAAVKKWRAKNLTAARKSDNDRVIKNWKSPEWRERHRARKRFYYANSEKYRARADMAAWDWKKSPKGLIFAYKFEAKYRNLEWAICDDAVLSLISGDCHYCGRKAVVLFSKRTGLQLPIPVGGIDRKNNSIGYTEENCVSCCYRCNRAKMDMGYADFLNMVSEVYFNRAVKLNEKNQTDQEHSSGERPSLRVQDGSVP